MINFYLSRAQALTLNSPRKNFVINNKLNYHCYRLIYPQKMNSFQPGGSSSKRIFKKNIHSSSVDQVDLFDIDGNLFAVKKMCLNSINNEEKKIEILNEKEKEYNLLTRGLGNVLKIQEYYFNEIEDSCVFIMEYYEKNLREFIRTEGALGINDFLPIFSDIISGIYTNYHYYCIIILFMFIYKNFRTKSTAG